MTDDIGRLPSGTGLSSPMEPSVPLSPPSRASIPSADDIPAVWRCAVSDTITAVDAAFCRPLQTSRKKAERELGDRLDRILQSIFDESRKHSPRSYPEAFSICRSLVASGTEARRAETAKTGSVHDGPVSEAETPLNPSGAGK